MLHDFLIEYRKEILQSVQQKIGQLQPGIESTPAFTKAIPSFYEGLIQVLQRTATMEPGDEQNHRLVLNSKKEEASFNLKKREAALRHGKETSRLGYTVSDMVHTYGAVCQAVTEEAHAQKKAISAQEFHGLNFAIDAAVAEAAIGFLENNEEKYEESFQLELRSLAHELRNPLSNAIMALELIRTGTVGLEGQTGKLLTRALERMQVLIETALSQSRKKALVLEPIPFNLSSLIQDTVKFSEYSAVKKNIILSLEVNTNLTIKIDPKHISGALLNLVQNAIKFTKPESNVWIRVKEKPSEVVIEIEDCCGGLPVEAETLFIPYQQFGSDRSGVGLGLTIAKRAIEAHGGKIAVKNKPEHGCIFTITLPRVPISENE